MSDPTYPLFSVFAFLGFIVALIPLPWHAQALNAGTCIYMFWASTSSLIQFINSIVWNGTSADIAPVWCDIATKLIIGAGVGVPASSLCINRRLYKIASSQAASVTRAERRRAAYIDICIAAGLPVLVMALHYIVQGHRFNIIEDIGCIPAIFNTPPAYPLVMMWPIFLGCISFVYAALTIHAFLKRRMQFSQMLASTSSMTTSRYFRLMLFSCLEMCLTLPLGAYSIYINTHGVILSPWVSWADTHFDFSHVEQVPAAIWRSDHSYVISVEMGRWIYPCTAFVFFALFGFAEEAKRHYRLVFRWIARRFGVTQSQRLFVNTSKGFRATSSMQKSTNDETLPPYSPPPRRRADSLVSSLNVDVDVEKQTNASASGKPAPPFPYVPSILMAPREDSSFGVSVPRSQDTMYTPAMSESPLSPLSSTSASSFDTLSLLMPVRTAQTSTLTYPTVGRL